MDALVTLEAETLLRAIEQRYPAAYGCAEGTPVQAQVRSRPEGLFLRLVVSSDGIVTSTSSFLTHDPAELPVQLRSFLEQMGKLPWV